MDMLKYEAARQQILNAKYVKGLEEIIQTHYSSLNCTTKCVNNKITEAYSLSYKVYCLALNTLSSKSSRRLPDFIYHYRLRAQINMLSSITSDPAAYDYQYIIDLFEFDTLVETEQYTHDHILPLHNIIQDKPLHFRIKFNQKLSTFDSYSTYKISRELQYYLHALRLRQVHSPDKSSTVINQYIDQTFKDIPKHADLSEQILLLQQHTSALQEYQQWQTTQTLN